MLNFVLAEDQRKKGLKVHGTRGNPSNLSAAANPAQKPKHVVNLELIDETSQRTDTSVNTRESSKCASSALADSFNHDAGLSVDDKTTTVVT